MGNHSVGRAMASAAEIYFRCKSPSHITTKEEALEILELAGRPWQNTDAEFGDFLHGETPIAQLVGIAFDATPAEIADRRTGDGELWYEGPITKFRAHFNFW